MSSERRTRNRVSIVCGVGINDADYVTRDVVLIDGVQKTLWICPFYNVWVKMIRRCYSESYHKRRPTYKDCVVCDEWLNFSNFRKWMVGQDWQGKQLDKDLLFVGNKLYSPDTCIFVVSKVNNFIIDNAASRGLYLIGACFDKNKNKFSSYCNNPFTKELEYLGYHTSELEAHLTWKKRKHELACQLADSEYVNDERLKEALKNRFK